MPPESPLIGGVPADPVRAKRKSAIELSAAQEVNQVLDGEIPDDGRPDVIVFSKKVSEVVAEGKSIVLDNQAVGRRKTCVQPFDAVG